MPPCEHCIHYTDCHYFYKSNVDWPHCDYYIMDRFTFREYTDDNTNEVTTP